MKCILLVEDDLSSNGITVRLLKGEVYKNNKQIELTAGEYKLLCLFMENPDQVLSQEQKTKPDHNRPAYGL